MCWIFLPHPARDILSIDRKRRISLAKHSQTRRCIIMFVVIVHLVSLKTLKPNFGQFYRDFINTFRDPLRGSCCLSYQHHHGAPTITRLHQLNVLLHSGPLLLHLLAIGPQSLRDHICTRTSDPVRRVMIERVQKMIRFRAITI